MRAPTLLDADSALAHFDSRPDEYNRFCEQIAIRLEADRFGCGALGVKYLLAMAMAYFEANRGVGPAGKHIR